MIIKLLLVVGVLIVVALTTLAILRRRDDRKVDGIWQSLEVTSPHQVFALTLLRLCGANLRKWSAVEDNWLPIGERCVRLRNRSRRARKIPQRRHSSDFKLSHSDSPARASINHTPSAPW